MAIYPFALEIPALRYLAHLLWEWMISWTIKSYVLYTNFRNIIPIYLDHLLSPNFHFIVPACENMISGTGMRPGDIVTASNGKTIKQETESMITVQCVTALFYYSPSLRTMPLCAAVSCALLSPSLPLFQIDGDCSETSSSADWKFAAEQFVKLLPNKVFVHQNGHAKREEARNLEL